MNRKQVYALIEEHYKKSFRSQVNRLKSATGGHHNAEEAVQEAYVRACKYWNTFDTDKTFDVWFSTILFNCTRDKQRDVILNGMVQEGAEIIDFPMGDVAFNRIATDEIKKKIKEYPKHISFILNMFLFYGYTSKEIAEFTDYKPEAIRKIVSRFRQEMDVAA